MHDTVAAGLLTGLAAARRVLSGAVHVAYVDLDDTVGQTYGSYGYAKQGAGRGYTGVNGLNALLAMIFTPLAAPVIAATRLRRGATNSVRGAAKLLADALATTRRAGAMRLLIVRADSAFFGYDIIAACRRAGARFRSPPAGLLGDQGDHPTIPEGAWVPIRYRTGVFDPDEGRWISNAQVAEIIFTAFTGRPSGDDRRQAFRSVPRTRGRGHHTAQGDAGPSAQP